LLCPDRFNIFETQGLRFYPRRLVVQPLPGPVVRRPEKSPDALVEWESPKEREMAV